MVMQQSFPGPNGVTDQTEARKDFSGLVIRDTSGNARAGVFPRHFNALVTARSDMQVDVAAFEAASVRGGGPLFIANDGTAQPTVGAIVSPASNSQYHVVYAKQNESAAPYSDANDLAILGIQSGAAAPTPDLAAVVAALPAGAVPLASVLMPTGKTATNQSGVVIAPIFPYTTTTGGLIWVRTAAELPAVTGFAKGTMAYCFGNDITYRFDGTTWKEWESDWITWSTAPTGIAIGTGGAASSLQRYKWICGRLYFDYKFVLGSAGASVATAPNLNLPFAISTRSAGIDQPMDTGTIYDTSAATVVGYTKHLMLTSTTVRISYNTASAWGITTVTALIPVTFAPGDVISGGFWGDPT